MFDLRELQHDDCIIGIASEGVPGEEINLTQKDAGSIGTAFMIWLAQKLDKPIFSMQICVGMDPRLSSESLKEGVMMGIQMTGSKSFDAGIASSHAMYMSTVMDFYEFDGAVMITAGYLPYNRNGFKFYTSEGPLEEDDIARILKMAHKTAFIGEWYECKPVNLMDMYATRLRALISRGLEGHTDKLKGMHIVVDAGNGSGGFFADKVLEKLGADTTGSIFLEPDGTFPHHQPDSDNEEAIASISKAVIDNHADMGIVFDGDLDCSTVVGPDGKVVDADDLIAVIVEAAKLKKAGKTLN